MVKHGQSPIRQPALFTTSTAWSQVKNLMVRLLIRLIIRLMLRTYKTIDKTNDKTINKITDNDNIYNNNNVNQVDQGSCFAYNVNQVNDISQIMT